MSPLDPLPAQLGTAFSVGEAVAAGMSPHALRRHDLRTPHRGVRARGTGSGGMREACREYAPRLLPGQFFSHETSLYLLGAPLPEYPYRPRIHISTHRPGYPPRIDGVVGHRLQMREPAQIMRDGLTLEHPVRAWRQAARLWPLDDLIAAAEHLISGPRPLARYEQLADEVAVMGDTSGGILTRALAEVRAGARSPKETRLRLVLTRAGLPEPEINWDLYDDDGAFVAEIDLAYPRWRVGPEYDGRVHAEDARQFARDADRWAAIRRAGWDHVRILNHHLAGDGSTAVRMVGDALRTAGWSPAR